MSINFLLRQNGLVAIFATLFMASYVKGDSKCVLNFDNENTMQFFDLNCNERSNLWFVNNIYGKNALLLDPEKEGCMRTLPITLDSNSTVAIKYLYDGNNGGNLTVRVTPLYQKINMDGKQCVWKVENPSEYKAGEWVDAKHKFSVPRQKYLITVEADQSKAKLAVNEITVHGQVSEDCDSNGIPKSLPTLDWLQSNGTVSAGYVETISRNLLLTSATVITLNNLLN